MAKKRSKDAILAKANKALKEKQMLNIVNGMNSILSNDQNQTETVAEMDSNASDVMNFVGPNSLFEIAESNSSLIVAPSDTVAIEPTFIAPWLCAIRFGYSVNQRSKFDEFIKDLNIKPIQGRDEYNGNACRKILQKFRSKSHQYAGPNKELFVTVANIELLKLGTVF
uniref:Uncharacterized protein n=1 Tax=Panagrolaimus superbus TaxID=310955 RepID=A0A914ZA29_9BILA